MQTYSHSGTVPLGGAIGTIVVGLAVAGVSGFVYAFAFRWMPIGFLRLLLLGGYCLVVGMTVCIAANRGKIRSPLFVTFIALLCTVFGYWIYWGAYRWAKEGLGIGLLAWSPSELVAFGQRLFEDGSFRLRRNKIEGWPLVGFWVAEVGVMIYAIVGLARSDAHRPFCETCREWTNEDPAVMRFASSGDEPAWQRILAGDFVELGRFETASEQTTPHVRLNLASCPQCVHSNFLTIRAVQVTMKKGEAKTKERTILRNALLTDMQMEMLRALAKMLDIREDTNEDDEVAAEAEEGLDGEA